MAVTITAGKKSVKNIYAYSVYIQYSNLYVRNEPRCTK